MPQIYFDERITERYDASAADMLEPAVIDPVVDVLAALAGDGAALELGVGTGTVAAGDGHRRGQAALWSRVDRG